MNKDFPGNRWLTAFVSFVILFNACACSASSQNTTHASTATAGAIATKVPATQTPTPSTTLRASPEPTATPTQTPTPEATATATVEPLILPEPVTKFELGKFSQLPEITIDQAESPAFDAYLDKEEAAGKLGDFSKYAEPFSPKWGTVDANFDSLSRPVSVINIPANKNGAYTLVNTRPCYNEIYFKTKFANQDYVLWVQRWKNTDGTTGRIKYIVPATRLETKPDLLKFFGISGGVDELWMLSPALLPANTDLTRWYSIDKNYFNTYWQQHGADMIKLVQDTAKNNSSGITEDFDRFIWIPFGTSANTMP